MVTDEEPVPQVEDDADTILEIMQPLHPITCRPTGRAVTSSDWPPAPPGPAAFAAPVFDEITAEAFALGTEPPRRRAGIYAAVRRPTTSSEPT